MKRFLMPSIVILVVIFLFGVFNASAQTGRIGPGQLKIYEDYLTEQGYSLSCSSGMDQFIDGGKTLLVRLNCINEKSQPVIVELSLQKNDVRISKMHPPQEKTKGRTPSKK